MNEFESAIIYVTWMTEIKHADEWQALTMFWLNMTAILCENN